MSGTVEGGGAGSTCRKGQSSGLRYTRLRPDGADDVIDKMRSDKSEGGSGTMWEGRISGVAWRNPKFSQDGMMRGVCRETLCPERNTCAPRNQRTRIYADRLGGVRAEPADDGMNFETRQKGANRSFLIGRRVQALRRVSPSSGKKRFLTLLLAISLKNIT